MTQDGVKVVDLGSGHSFTFLTGRAESFPTTDERLRAWKGDPQYNLVGIIEHHTKRDGTECGGGVMFVRAGNPSEHEAARPIWQVHSVDPLHIEPSVQCTAEGCGSHGHIRNGRWQEA